jgi:hypothetical protein
MPLRLTLVTVEAVIRKDPGYAFAVGDWQRNSFFHHKYSEIQNTNRLF